MDAAYAPGTMQNQNGKFATEEVAVLLPLVFKIGFVSSEIFEYIEAVQIPHSKTLNYNTLNYKTGNP